MKTWLKRYFIPHADNEYKPHILQKTAVVMMAGLVLLTFTASNLQALLWLQSDWLVGAILPSVIVDLTNEERSYGDIGQLTRSSVLDRAAQMKAEDMAKYSYFAHFAPDGTSPWYWFDQVGYNYQHAGENLAVHFVDSDEVVKAWMNSPAHRENIMNGKYKEIGVGTARGVYQGYDTVFVVQLFGTQAPTAVAATEPAATTAVIPAAAAAEPEPAPVAVAPAPVPEPVAAAESGSEPAAAPVTETTVVDPAVVAELASQDGVEVIETPNSVSLVSDTAETSQIVAGADADVPLQHVAGSSDPIYTAASLATQPQRTLNMLYFVTAVFVFFALMASILIEIRKQHTVQIAYGVMLLLIMFGLSYLHVVVTNGALIV